MRDDHIDLCGQIDFTRTEAMPLLARDAHFSFACNGCGDCKLKNQAGIEEKLARIASLQVDAVHVGVCTKHRNDMGEQVTCRKIVEICERLRAAGITIVEGTHE